MRLHTAKQFLTAMAFQAAAILTTLPASAQDGANVATPGASHAARPNIAFVTVIGTMLRNPADRTNYTRYGVTGETRLTATELIANLPEVRRYANVVIDSDRVWLSDSSEERVNLARFLNERLKDQAIDGMVVAHGTNNLEETAYFLNLTLRTEKPVVVTGSQRPFTALSSDGPINLLNAVRVASDKASVGKGVLVATNGEILAARDVVKSNTYNLSTFRTPEVGLLGYSDPDRIVFYRAPTRTHTANSEFDIATMQSLPKVTILYGYSGDDGDAAQAAVAAGALGLVIAGTGAGHTGNARPVLKRLQDEKKIVVVRSARVGSGRVICDDNWAEPGFICADNLSPQKARLLLQLAMTKTRSSSELQRIFDKY